MAVSLQIEIFFVSAAPVNILFLMSDQHRFDMLGVAGSKGVKTPNLDSLAKEGLHLKNSYSSTPTCTPARGALLTGMSPWGHGMLGYGAVANKYAYEMPVALADAGYYTASFGKDHFGWNKTSDTGKQHGFEHLMLYDGLGNGFPTGGEYDNYDRWFQKEMPGKDPMATGLDWNTWHGAPYVYDEFYHPTAWTGRMASNFIMNYTGSRPFFLKVSFHRPHSPYDPPARLLNATKYEDLRPIYTGNDWDEMFRDNKKSNCGGLTDAWCGEMPMDKVKLSRRAYHASISFLDENIGKILMALQKKKLMENTFILFTSDHGDGQSDHWHWRKGYPYEFSSHVPGIVRWPDSMASRVKIKRGSVTDLVTELRDVMLTFLDVANIKAPTGPNYGSSIVCLLSDPSGKSCNWREWLDLEHSTCYNASNHWNALTDGKMKYVFNALHATEQLFDLTNDPHEIVELSQNKSHAVDLKLWRSRMVAQFQKEGRGPTWVSADGKLLARPKGQTYGPNYPHNPPHPPPPAGSAVVMEGSSDQFAAAQEWIMDRAGSSQGTNIKLISNASLCITVTSNRELDLNACEGSAAQTFTYSKAEIKMQVVHKESKMCITVNATKPGTRAFLKNCAPENAKQMWVYGSSGRLCQGPCLTGGKEKEGALGKPLGWSEDYIGFP